VRIIVLAGLAVGAIAVFGPEHGADLTQSVVQGFAWTGGRGWESGPPAADREQQGSARSGHPQSRQDDIAKRRLR
jgi:hypothetical protein